jgi:hypothetical protein
MFDIEDLEDQIAKTHSQLYTKQKEHHDLFLLVETKEIFANQLRQELAIALHDDLRFAVDEESRDVGWWRLQSDKIEMQILKSEIRLALPTLEKEVILWETLAGKSLKNGTRNPKQKLFIGKKTIHDTDCSCLLRDNAAVRSENGDMLGFSLQLENSIRLNTNKDRDFQGKLTSELSQLRKELKWILDEREQLEKLCVSLSNHDTVDRTRRDLIVAQFVETRARLSAIREGLGWQSEIFEQASGMLSF